jgi:hypothetical protein
MESQPAVSAEGPQTADEPIKKDQEKTPDQAANKPIEAAEESKGPEEKPSPASRDAKKEEEWWDWLMGGNSASKPEEKKKTPKKSAKPSIGSKAKEIPQKSSGSVKQPNKESPQK